MNILAAAGSNRLQIRERASKACHCGGSEPPLKNRARERRSVEEICWLRLRSVVWGVPDGTILYQMSISTSHPSWLPLFLFSWTPLFSESVVVFFFLLGFPMSSSFDRWSPCEGDGLLLAACLIATYSASMSWSVDRSSSCCWVSRLRLVFPVGRCRRLQVSEGRSPGQPHCRRSSPPLLDTFVQKQPNFLFPKLLLFKTCCPPLIVPPSSSSLSNQHTQKNWMFTSLDSP